jgi:hypothetical protein
MTAIDTSAKAVADAASDLRWNGEGYGRRHEIATLLEALASERDQFQEWNAQAQLRAERAEDRKVRVKPLAWREIDPGNRYVGTGLGFTCEVHRLHKGGWEAVWPLNNGEFINEADAIAACKAAYEKMVLAYVEVWDD